MDGDWVQEGNLRVLLKCEGQWCSSSTHRGEDIPLKIYRKVHSLGVIEVVTRIKHSPEAANAHGSA